MLRQLPLSLDAPRLAHSWIGRGEAQPAVLAARQVAAEEIFVNIALYAYAPETGRADITFDVNKEKKEAVITFRDKGVAFNPLEKQDPDVTQSAEERQIGGLGIYIVKKTMDEVKYERTDGENVLTIRKKF